MVVLQRPLGTVELAQIVLGLHQDVSQFAPLAAHDLVDVLIGDVDLGGLAGFAEDDADGQLEKLDEEDAQVQPAQVVRGQEAQLGIGGGLALGGRGVGDDGVGDGQADGAGDDGEHCIKDCDNNDEMGIENA